MTRKKEKRKNPDYIYLTPTGSQVRRHPSFPSINLSSSLSITRGWLRLPYHGGVEEDAAEKPPGTLLDLLIVLS